jgi:uncharacterized protein CbrC (UPF0167 family)
MTVELEYNWCLSLQPYMKDGAIYSSKHLFQMICEWIRAFGSPSPRTTEYVDENHTTVSVQK